LRRMRGLLPHPLKVVLAPDMNKASPRSALLILSLAITAPIVHVYMTRPACRCCWKVDSWYIYIYIRRRRRSRRRRLRRRSRAVFLGPNADSLPRSWGLFGETVLLVQTFALLGAVADSGRPDMVSSSSSSPEPLSHSLRLERPLQQTNPPRVTSHSTVPHVGLFSIAAQATFAAHQPPLCSSHARSKRLRSIDHRAFPLILQDASPRISNRGAVSLAKKPAQRGLSPPPRTTALS
jgi:hypothetical protein